MQRRSPAALFPGLLALAAMVSIALTALWVVIFRPF